MRIKIKRVYLAPEPGDGFRVLVDRLWPRGLKKESAGVDLWLKELAPSDSLRKWFGHAPARWESFRKRYFHELDSGSEAVERLAELKGKKIVTLVFGAKDEEHNNAVALKEYLKRKRIG